MNPRSMISEFIGTFALIFIGAGAVALGADLIVVALAHGFVIIAFAYAYGHISGTHINPAVTFGLLIAGEIKIVNAIGYWISQFIGAILAGLTLVHVLGDKAGTLGVTVFSEGVTSVQGLSV